MKFVKSADKFKDILIFKPRKYTDDRGQFSIPFEISVFQKHAGEYNIIQENFSVSSRNVIRGLHYQIENAQGKLISVDYGAIFDVAVDIRKSSPTFGECFSIVLSAETSSVWIPPGYAHGFCAITPNTKMVYKCTNKYSPEHERSILYCDPDLNIAWPKLGEEAPILSEKDLAAPRLRDAEVYS